MKAEITQNKKAFEPIELKITIESLEELSQLHARLDLVHWVIKENSSVDISDEDVTDKFSDLLHTLYKKYK